MKLEIELDEEEYYPIMINKVASRTDEYRIKPIIITEDMSNSEIADILVDLIEEITPLPEEQGELQTFYDTFRERFRTRVIEPEVEA